MGDDRIPKDQAGELAGCFVACAPRLFGYACVLARGDSVRADDLVQATFEAAAARWPTVRDLPAPERLGWLRTALANLAMEVFRGDAGRDREAGSDHEAGFLAHLYQQATDRQVARYAVAYDVDAGVARFQDWLRERAPASEDEALQVALTAAMQADVEPTVPIPVAGRAATSTGAETADEAVRRLYSIHYRSLVRLAGLLVRDEPTAGEIVQECFIAMHGGWHRLRDEDKALSYLKNEVVHRSRSVLRGRSGPGRNAPKRAPDTPNAGPGSIAHLERSDVIAALQALPERQRQALVLRYYAGLSEAQMAKMMGISKGAVKSHTARGMSSLRAVLERARKA